MGPAPPFENPPFSAAGLTRWSSGPLSSRRWRLRSRSAFFRERLRLRRTTIRIRLRLAFPRCLAPPAGRSGFSDLAHPSDESRAANLEASLDAAADRNWEIREAQERTAELFRSARRRDRAPRTASARSLTPTTPSARSPAASRESNCSHEFHAAGLEQSETILLADGTRTHDQKIAAAEGARWIAWREVTVRADGASEMQSVGRDVTDRVNAERALARGARSGGSRQPRQVTLSGHGLARDPHAAERHSRHGGPLGDTPLIARADRLI